MLGTLGQLLRKFLVGYPVPGTGLRSLDSRDVTAPCQALTSLKTYDELPRTCTRNLQPATCNFFPQEKILHGAET